MTKIYDAIIIGAGHNGLTAALYLARSGWKTLVLERNERIGGAPRLTCPIEQAGGFTKVGHEPLDGVVF